VVENYLPLISFMPVNRYGARSALNNSQARRSMADPAGFPALSLANSVVPLKSKIKASLFSSLYENKFVPNMNDILFPAL